MYILKKCGYLKKNESLYIIFDVTTDNIANLFYKEAIKITQTVKAVKIPQGKKHGEEPPKIVSNEIKEFNLIIAICKYSLAHSKARIDASKKGARFLSLPFFDKSLLKKNIFSFNYHKNSKFVRKITDKLTRTSKIEITTVKGTKLYLKTNKRIANFCPGFVKEPGDLSSPPDIESNIAPIENKSNGVIVVDGSVTSKNIGLLKTPLILTIRNGKIIEITSKDNKNKNFLNKILGELNSKKRILGELGFGLNPKAKLCGSMLIDEGVLGSVHFGFGSNFTFGGKNKIDFHLDFICTKATIKLDSDYICIDGKYL